MGGVYEGTSGRSRMFQDGNGMGNSTEHWLRVWPNRDGRLCWGTMGPTWRDKVVPKTEALKSKGKKEFASNKKAVTVFECSNNAKAIIHKSYLLIHTHAYSFNEAELWDRYYYHHFRMRK